ncbi:hypothetical protein [Micromonospora musae]|uniref:hypothetical protein n=1 Tax=Micromonospora musae TaxID=1894970 RepID=UPI00343C4268
MLHVLSYLEERDVDLEQSEFDAESAAINKVHDLTVLITPAHKRFLDQLDPAGHREEELAAHLEEMGLDFEESGMAGLDALTLLHDSISELRDNQVLLLHIGRGQMSAAGPRLARIMNVRVAVRPSFDP